MDNLSPEDIEALNRITKLLDSMRQTLTDREERHEAFVTKMNLSLDKLTKRITENN